MTNSTDKPQQKKPQEIKAEKLRAQFKDLTGISFPEGDPLGTMLAAKLNDSILTGARRIDTANEDSPIECNAEWHFVRFRGPGKNLVPLLYGISFHIAKESGSFFLSGKKLAKYLQVKEDDIYAAAHLLVASGFWQVNEAEIGKAVRYRPIGHKEWEANHPGRCTVKIKPGFSQDDEALALLGKNLHAILGGEMFFPNVVAGLRRAAMFDNPAGLSDDEICEQAKRFIAADNGKGSGKERRKRFAEYLRNLARASSPEPKKQ